MHSFRIQKLFLFGLFASLVYSSAIAQPQARPVRIAILDFGDTQTAKRVTEKITHSIKADGIVVVDRDQTRAAASGAGYRGSLNMTREDARNLGSAIGCDFFFTGEAQTLRRSSSNEPVYFEAYASLFLVSARTGRLVSWQKASTKQATPEDAEKALLDEELNRERFEEYRVAIHRALQDESVERAQAVENSPPVIEVMADENGGNQDGTRPPRPYRRLKPDYPEVAALTGVEATVDALVDVDERGEITRLEIARWAGYGLDQSVLETVKQMHFFPAMRDRVAIPMRVLLRYNFRKPAQK